MKKEKVEAILSFFEELYPNARCELTHSNNYELLVAVILSAQTTDESVNKITPSLFKKYPTPEALKNAETKELESYIHSIGLFRNKAKNLKLMATKLVDKYNSIVPNTREELEELPGVGRKTTNVVLSVCFDIPAFAVDTHVDRVSKRLGIAKKSDSVLTVEKKLMKSIDKNRWNKAHHQFIFFGRYFCKAKKPECKKCKLYDMCKDPIKKAIKI